MGDKILGDTAPRQTRGKAMKIRFYGVMGLICASSASGAWAQAAPADLVAAYRAGVAAAKCDLALDSAKSSALGDAVQRIEQRSGLGQNDLDALWAKTQDEAEADNAAYCAKEAGRIDAAISLAK
jgi:Skp family chaperone for outer membrane proteins